MSVAVEEGLATGTTLVTYDAQAGVRGLVARLGSATLSVVGAHLTGCFFRDLDRSLVASRRRYWSAATHARSPGADTAREHCSSIRS